MKTCASLHPSIEPLESRIAPASVFAINDNNGLFSFDSASPANISSITPITGLGAGQLIKAMDFRPADGLLYGIAVSGTTAPFTGQLYKINFATCAATAVGAPFSTTLASISGIGMDFNPVADRIRMTDTGDENIRLNPDTGAIAGTDTAISVASVAAGLAYTNNYPGATVTTLYAVDYSSDDLHIIGGLNGNPSPNGGVGTKVADIGVITDASTSDRIGFDILTTLEGSTAFYSGRFSAEHRLYTLDLATGAATLAGIIGNGTTPVLDIAVSPHRASFTPGKSFTYTDGDGDLVTVKTSAGTLDPAQFGWLFSADGTRRELTSMNISGNTTFTGASLTFSAKKTATGGDGRVNIGTIDATGLNLGAVKVGGNIERIIAGTNDAVIPAVKSLGALSFGSAPGTNQPGTIVSTVTGNLPLVKIKGDLVGANLTITGKVGTALIGGSLIGGSGPSTGYFSVQGESKSVTVLGSIIGGDGSSSGGLILPGQNNIVKVGGSVVGGGGGFSGRILINTGAKAITSFTVGGSIIGGDGGTSGTVSFGKANAVAIGGSIIAGDGSGSGSVGGSSAGTFKIAGSVIGGDGTNSASVAPGVVGAFTLGGSLIGGIPASDYSGQLHFSTAKSVLIKGSVIGQPGTTPAIVGFAGKASPMTVAESIAVGSLTIKGSVTNADILFGEGFPGAIDKGDVAAGKITIGGDFHASSITAGVGRGADKFFGNADDVPSMAGNATIKAAIGSIIIKGRATGTASDGDHFGIQAENLGSVSIAGRKLPLTAAAQDNVPVGINSDFRVRELTFV